MLTRRTRDGLAACRAWGVSDGWADGAAGVFDGGPAGVLTGVGCGRAEDPALSVLLSVNCLAAVVARRVLEAGFGTRPSSRCWTASVARQSSNASWAW